MINSQPYTTIFFLLLFSIPILSLVIPQPLTLSFKTTTLSTQSHHTGIFHINSDSLTLQHTSPSTPTLKHFHHKNTAFTQSERGIKCHPPHAIPPFHEEMMQSFRIATLLPPQHIASLRDTIRSCPMQLYDITFAGLHYLLCTNGKDEFYSLHGEDFDTYFFEEDYVESIFVPEHNCEDSSYRSIVHASLEMGSVSEAWYERTRWEGEQKVCIFLHGTGQRIASNWTTSFPAYWGNLGANGPHTPQCSESYFVHADTVNFGWDDEATQKKYCEVATLFQSDTKIIQNRVVFTHSLGNLILAAAIENGFCELDSSSSWYAIAGPFGGSTVASWLEEACANDTIIEWGADLLHYCIGRIISPAYKSGEAGTPGLDKLAPIAKPRIKGSMCGTSAYGLQSIYSVPLDMIQALSGLEDPNDGLVWYKSCNIKGNFTSDDAKADFYSAASNHADLTCRNGNGYWGSARQPCTYYYGKL